MKIALFGLENIELGKESLPDERLNNLQEIFKSKKNTPIQVELIPIEQIKDAEALLSLEEKKLDLILSDLDYVQERLSKDIPEEEKVLFKKCKEALEKEQFLYQATDSDEKKFLKGFPLRTILPIYLAKDEDSLDTENFVELHTMANRICFFTAGEREARAWSLRKGQTAWEAAGCIHSDIQQGFIRAETMSIEDLFKAGHYNQAKNEGKLRLENKEYVVQEGDLILFRFNK